MGRTLESGGTFRPRPGQLTVTGPWGTFWGRPPPIGAPYPLTYVGGNCPELLSGIAAISWSGERSSATGMFIQFRG